MAEEAFALSPINARPNVPGEADYEAIREAFMETARGRWFLAEYAKRNRNADTNLLLDAVARLESNLAAGKQQPQGLSLTAALGAIRAAVRQAKATAIEALPRQDGGETQTAARNGARIVREIARTMRECGADVRICDLLETQTKAIDIVLQAETRDGREAVLTSYDALMERIEALADGAPAKAEAPVAPAAAAPTPAPEAREASVTPLFKAPEPEPAPAPEPEPTPAPVAEEPPAVAAEDAEDLAVLDAVAMEMGALDADDLFDTPVEPAPAIADELTLAEIAEAVLAPEPAAPSLGAALIAHGVIADPKAPASDPLAPVRRMTQAEKIAFFS